MVRQAGDSSGNSMSLEKEGKLTSALAAKACTALALASSWRYNYRIIKQDDLIKKQN